MNLTLPKSKFVLFGFLFQKSCSFSGEYTASEAALKRIKGDEIHTVCFYSHKHDGFQVSIEWGDEKELKMTVEIQFNGTDMKFVAHGDSLDELLHKAEADVRFLSVACRRHEVDYGELEV